MLSRRPNAKSQPPMVLSPAASAAANAASKRYHRTKRTKSESSSSRLLRLLLSRCLPCLAFAAGMFAIVRSFYLPGIIPIVSNNANPNSNNAAPSLLPEQLERDKVFDGVDPASLSDGCAPTNRSQKIGIDTKTTKEASFGLPLVASWRSFPPTMESSYQKLVTKLLPCFRSTSGYNTHPNGSTTNDKIDCVNPEAHVFPFEDLHITVATFRTARDYFPSNPEDVHAMKQFCTTLLENASKRDEWPKQNAANKVDGDTTSSSTPKLRLRPKSIRLSRKNAILLWEETTGTLAKMRSCIQKEMQQSQSQIQMTNNPKLKELIGASLASYDIPPIVHSTFLRFWNVPSHAERIVHTFQNEISVESIFFPEEEEENEYYELEVEANVKLIQEGIPCMHSNEDQHIVLWEG